MLRLKLNSMERVKTFQEIKIAFNEEWSYTYGLPLGKVKKRHREFINDEDRTTEPHPYDSMDITVEVTPNQTKKLQKKAFKMGYTWCGNSNGILWDLNCEVHTSVFLAMNKKLRNGADSNGGEPVAKLTYKQFMRGDVPEAKKSKSNNMKTKKQMYQCPYVSVIKCDMANPCSGCEDFTGESDKPKDKEFIVGEYYKGSAGTIVKCESACEYTFLGTVVDRGDGLYDVGKHSSTWSNEFFTHLPDYKEEFKVGDWVEIVNLDNTQDVYYHGGRIGDVFKITNITHSSCRLSVYKRNPMFHLKDIKHTTKRHKPEPEPLTFNGHEVKVVGDNIKIGTCTTITKEDLKSFVRVCASCTENHVILYEAYEFAIKHKEKLGL